jgi:tripartite-type tricarboxylate transporter receptor subunit TctC
LPYNPLKDFKPVSLVGAAPMVMVVNATLPVHSLPDLVKLSREPGRNLNYSSPGTGTPTDIGIEAFKHKSGANIQQVSFKSGADAMNALLGNQVHVTLVTFAIVRAHVKAGTVRPLAVMGPSRIGEMPDLPTFTEAKMPIPDDQADQWFKGVWFGMLAPAGTPQAIVDRLSSLIAQAIRRPDVAERMRALGYDSVGSTPGEFGQMLTAHAERWPAIINRAGITAP